MVYLAYESIITIGSLLLTNSDFRIFLSDLNQLGRQVFADTASTLSDVSEEAVKQIEPSTEESQALKHPGSANVPASTPDDLIAESSQVLETVADGVKKTGSEARTSLIDNLSGDERDTLLFRLKTAVGKLRKRNDYRNSVSTIGVLIERYAKVYSRAVDKSISTVQDDIETNEDLDRAMKNGWSLLASFGDKDEWERLETCFNAVIARSQTDPEFENLVEDLAASVQKIFTDPDFFAAAGDKFEEVKGKSNEIGTQSALRKDIDALARQARKTFDCMLSDKDVSRILQTAARVLNIISPIDGNINMELLVDSYSVLIPLLIQAIQYIPIPRLEVSVPEIDLLLENLILEPGRTINNTSFLPFKLRINTNNELTIRKGRHGMVSALTTLVTVNVNGLSIRADEVGFWFRAHKGLFSLADQGIASFELDDRGIDVAIDFEVGKDRLEKIISLRNVKVKIHHLSYTLQKSKFACLTWIFKPILRPIMRKVLEHKMSTAIEEVLHVANRELLYARERLRATRISDPKDLSTFVRAVITRLTPAENPDLYTNVGIAGGAHKRGSVFAGVYAPGSVVRLWQEEAQQAGERLRDNDVDERGWRNEIFDVQTHSMQW
jgi:hypothetical protein